MQRKRVKLIETGEEMKQKDMENPGRGEEKKGQGQDKTDNTPKKKSGTGNKEEKPKTEAPGAPRA